MNFDPTFWLLVSFLMLLILGFKKVKNLVTSAILKYKNSIINIVEAGEKERAKSEIELSKLKNKTQEIEEICKSIRNSAVLESERMENEMKHTISSYLSFKEKNIQEKVNIHMREEISKIKAKVATSSLQAVTSYLLATKKEKEINYQELINIISSNNE